MDFAAAKQVEGYRALVASMPSWEDVFTRGYGLWDR